MQGTTIIPQPNNKRTVWYSNGTTQDIINSVNRAAVEPITATETRNLALQLAGNTLQQTCRNIYNYLRTLNYKEDEIGKQYIPSISQIIHGRKRADCKGYSLITAGILQNLNIPYYRRYARYPDPETGSHNTEATHVYTIVPTGNGSYICIDGTLSTFTEAPGALEVFDFKDDYKPGTINGIGQQPFYPGYDNTIPLYNYATPQAQGRPSWLVLELKRRYKSYADSIEGRPSMIGRWTPFKDIKSYVQNVKKYSVAENALHAAAAINPATLASREAFKLILNYNVLGMASILAYAYKTNVDAWNKIDSFWYSAGGDTSNLIATINNGKTKVPRQVAPAVLNQFPQIKNLIQKANTIYYDKLAGAAIGVEPTTTTATVSSAAPPWVVILGILASSGVLAKITDKVLNNPTDGTDFTDTSGGTGTNGGGALPPEKSFIEKNIVPIGLSAVALGTLLFWNE